MKRDYYSDSITNFLQASPDEILGKLVRNSDFPVEQSQRDAWLEEMLILKNTLSNVSGAIYFEYSIPRMGKRIDVLLLIGPVIFILEFKIGEREFTAYALNQVYDYALDLKNFHETSRNALIAPVVIASQASTVTCSIATTPHNDNVLLPIRCNAKDLGLVLEQVREFSDGDVIDRLHWEDGRYSPTPTIIEAAIALYKNHSVTDISRSDAGATNLSITSEAISEVIQVKAFIQNVHHFRDECLIDPEPPIEHVALFDEAQRAWDKQQTVNFMRRKKNTPNFNYSEPEFLVSCLDRHCDWAVVACLVGGGQEINTGEAGISEWIEALNRSFPDWHVYISSRLTDSEYAAGLALEKLQSHSNEP
jgi:hypothetical protein